MQDDNEMSEVVQEPSKWRVKFKSGLMPVMEFWATDSGEASKMAVAEYRKNCIMVDLKPLNEVVESVELVSGSTVKA